jgi:hypothetical protein
VHVQDTDFVSTSHQYDDGEAHWENFKLVRWEKVHEDKKTDAVKVVDQRKGSSGLGSGLGGAGGKEMLGRRFEMYWPAEEEWFYGTVIKVHVSGQHIVEWEDREISIHDLGNEKIRWVSEQRQGDDEAGGGAAMNRKDRPAAEEECKLETLGQGHVGTCERLQNVCQEDQDENDSSMPPGLEELC